MYRDSCGERVELAMFGFIDPAHGIGYFRQEGKGGRLRPFDDGCRQADEFFGVGQFERLQKVGTAFEVKPDVRARTSRDGPGERQKMRVIYVRQPCEYGGGGLQTRGCQFRRMGRDIAQNIDEGIEIARRGDVEQPAAGREHVAGKPDRFPAMAGKPQTHPRPIGSLLDCQSGKNRIARPQERVGEHRRALAEFHGEVIAVGQFPVGQTVGRHERQGKMDVTTCCMAS